VQLGVGASSLLLRGRFWLGPPPRCDRGSCRCGRERLAGVPRLDDAVAEAAEHSDDIETDLGSQLVNKTRNEERDSHA